LLLKRHRDLLKAASNFYLWNHILNRQHYSVLES
jgi:hypothetical protein